MGRPKGYERGKVGSAQPVSITKGNTLGDCVALNSSRAAYIDSGHDWWPDYLSSADQVD